LQSILGSLRFVAAAFGLMLAACTSPASSPGPAPPFLQPATGATLAAIDPDDIRLRVGLLAHDSLMGRETGSPGIETAARYLASEMERLGLTPAGDAGTFLQAVPLQRTLSRLTATIETDHEPAVPLGLEDILPVSGIGGLPPAARGDGEGPIVFAGHLVDPLVAADELDPRDLQSAVVIVRLSLPPGVDGAGAAPRITVASLFGPASPAAAILLVAEEGENDFWHYAEDVAHKGAISFATPSSQSPGGPPFFLITPSLAERLIGEPLASARRPRLDLGALEFATTIATESIDAWNVAAIIPGADPARSTEYVGLGAHYDHVGVKRPVNGDSIFNGADDNASGTVALLEVAEALAHLPEENRPARSVLLVWKTGEEHGLLGSEYFTDHPTVPRDSIVAHLNLDMVGRNHPDSLVVVGSRRISTELGEVVERVNQRQTRPFAFDYSMDAPGHPEQIYCRSDHYSYARYGIPVVFFTTGLHEDYHLPSDRPEKLDYDKLTRVSTLVRDVTMELANRPSRPRADQPVPPLGSPCQ